MMDDMNDEMDDEMGDEINDEMNNEIVQIMVTEAQERDLDFHRYLKDGGSAIDLLQLAIPLFKSGRAMPERFRVDLIQYLEKRLSAELKDNKTDRAFLRRKRLLPRQASQRVKMRVALKEISEAKAQREVLKKIRLLDGFRGLSEEALKKMIQRIRK